MLEKYSYKAKGEQLEIINLMPGGVLIVEPSTNNILFKNELIQEMRVVQANNKTIEDKIFKIVSLNILNKMELGAVRLIEENEG